MHKLTAEARREMTKHEQLEIKLFGLARDSGGDVRADVFARKLGALVRALKAADRQANGSKTYEYFIKDLEYGSAYAAVAEQPHSTKKMPAASSVALLQTIAENVRDGRGIPRGTSPKIAAAVAEFGAGADEKFSHGEIGIRGNQESVVRIDKFFDRRAARAYDNFLSEGEKAPLYEGVAHGTFDGTLKEVDLRGTVASAKLILNVGGIELDCTCNSVTVDNLREALDSRVTVTGLAHYNGEDRLPEQLDIKKIEEMGELGSLKKWRGKFDLPYASSEDIW